MTSLIETYSGHEQVLTCLQLFALRKVTVQSWSVSAAGDVPDVNQEAHPRCSCHVHVNGQDPAGDLP